MEREKVKILNAKSAARTDLMIVTFLGYEKRVWFVTFFTILQNGSKRKQLAEVARFMIASWQNKWRMRYMWSLYIYIKRYWYLCNLLYNYSCFTWTIKIEWKI